MAILHANVICEKTVMIPQPSLSNVQAAEESVIGITSNLEGDNASTNVSINGNDIDEFSEGVYNERQANKNLGIKRKIDFQGLHLEKRKIKLMEERLMKKSQADKDYMCQMSFILSIKKKKAGNMQRLELRIEFLSSVTRRFLRIFCGLLIVFPQLQRRSETPVRVFCGTVNKKSKNNQ
jgi:hypothetical protein